MCPQCGTRPLEYTTEGHLMWHSETYVYRFVCPTCGTSVETTTTRKVTLEPIIPVGPVVLTNPMDLRVIPLPTKAMASREAMDFITKTNREQRKR